MNPNDHGRKEPSLADLEAFEKLLRESLHDEPVAAAPAAPLAAPTPAAPMSQADHDAMAELTRLIEQPLDFALPTLPGARSAPEPVAPVPPPIAPAAPELHTHLEAGFGRDWPTPPHVETHLAPESHPVEPVHAPVAMPVQAPVEIPAPPPSDPLAAFEEELRRFDATRIVMPAHHEPAVVTPRLEAEVSYPPISLDPHAAAPAAYSAHEEPHHPPAQTAHDLDPAPAQHSSALDDMEERLAAEAAAASYAQPEAAQGTDVHRSRGVFMALGGIAAAGLLVIGGMFVFGGSKRNVASGDVPVITAKSEPAKEKPADPGGVEIPNQNAQVLSGRDVTKDTGPAKQVVNTTEQPLDLKEVTRRESVRIVSPNPFQQPATPTAESAQAGQKPAEVEPRRVTSVRVPTGGESAAPSSGTAAAVGAGAAAAAAIAAVGSKSSAKADSSINVPSAAELNTPPDRIGAPKSDARPPKKADTPKTEAPKATTPAKVANASSTPKAKAPEKTSADKAGLRTGNGPMSLTGDGKAKNQPVGGAGTFAVQLASRPTESDARSAASSLGSKYSGQLGGKAARVVSGEANGQTVYRVRAGGYSQAAATEVCNKIKAAGGACFIAKQ